MERGKQVVAPTLYLSDHRHRSKNYVANDPTKDFYDPDLAVGLVGRWGVTEEVLSSAGSFSLVREPEVATHVIVHLSKEELARCQVGNWCQPTIGGQTILCVSTTRLAREPIGREVNGCSQVTFFARRPELLRREEFLGVFLGITVDQAWAGANDNGASLPPLIQLISFALNYNVATNLRGLCVLGRDIGPICGEQVLRRSGLVQWKRDEVQRYLLSELRCNEVPPGINRLFQHLQEESPQTDIPVETFDTALRELRVLMYEAE